MTGKHPAGLRKVTTALPTGWFIAADCWDIESGGLDLEARGHGATHQQIYVGIPCDGGIAWAAAGQVS
jgi:hypothetical protein